nr:3-hydroxyacyl-CoA dehydrogenase family protein [Salsuginibacillus kocurii]
MVKDQTLSQEKITVVGTGLMGHSIALSIAWAGDFVKLYGINQDEITKAKNHILEKLENLVGNELITNEEKDAVWACFSYEDELEAALEDATMVIEAAPENLELKQGLYEQMDRICNKEVILASNTSSLQPTKIASFARNPERILVAHFWNPAHLLPLVEVVLGEKTEERFVERTMKVLKKLNKEPIRVEKEILGFVGNRLQYALFREAQYIYEEGVCTVEEIDKAVETSIGRRLGATGPFMTADMGGLDVFSSISDYIFPDLSNEDSSLATMKEKVSDGKYGQKNGEGFYKWDEAFSRYKNQERENELIRWIKKEQ